MAAAPSCLISWRWRGGGKPRREAAARPIDRIVATLRQWRQRARARRELANFDDYLLHDIGLSRSQAQFESGKPSEGLGTAVRRLPRLEEL